VVERNYDAAPLVDQATTKGRRRGGADTGELKLQAGVSELDAGRLKFGMPALISVQAARTDVDRPLVALAP